MSKAFYFSRVLLAKIWVQFNSVGSKVDLPWIYEEKCHKRDWICKIMKKGVVQKSFHVRPIRYACIKSRRSEERGKLTVKKFLSFSHGEFKSYIYCRLNFQRSFQFFSENKQPKQYTTYMQELSCNILKTLPVISRKWKPTKQHKFPAATQTGLPCLVIHVVEFKQLFLLVSSAVHIIEEKWHELLTYIIGDARAEKSLKKLRKIQIKFFMVLYCSISCTRMLVLYM